jgi:AraC-like DNA-binding protein
MEGRLRRLRQELSRIARSCGYHILPWRNGGELRLALMPGEEALPEGELPRRIEAGLAEYGRRESVTPRALLTGRSSRARDLARWATQASVTLERSSSSPALVHTGEFSGSGDGEAERYDLERTLLAAMRRGEPQAVRALGERLLKHVDGEEMLREQLTYLAHALRVPAVSLEGTPGERERFLTALEELRRRLAGSAPPETSPVVRRVREYIDHHYMEDLTLELLAKIGAVSEYHLSRLFKRETGQTVVGYITERRLRTARELLSEGLLSVKEVSARSGFGDPSYFSRVFTRREGVSPSDFRRQRATP